MKKYVVTDTLSESELTWNDTERIPGGEAVARIMPVILGGGKSIFSEDGAKRPFELVSTARAKTGVQVSVYRPVADEV
jgi:hypothetical protein